jgi:hypothetical protein
MISKVASHQKSRCQALAGEQTLQAQDQGCCDSCMFTPPETRGKRDLAHATPDQEGLSPDLTPNSIPHGYPGASRKTSGLACPARVGCFQNSALQEHLASPPGAVPSVVLSLIPTARLDAASAHRRALVPRTRHQPLNSALSSLTKAEETRRARAKASLHGPTARPRRCRRPTSPPLHRGIAITYV